VTVVRFDLASRQVDTVGRLGGPSRAGAEPDEYFRVANVVWLGGRNAGGLAGSGDDWAVLSDGSIAFVRGHDYHVDWVRANGQKTSTAKLPFDWQSLSDTTAAGRARLAYQPVTLRTRPDSAARGVDSIRRAVSLAAGSLRYALSVVTEGGSGAITPDLDGNVWILPTSTPDADDRLVYDVVNTRGELIQRVRLFPGRSIAGFGRNGTVYQQVRGYGVTIERTRFVAGRR
jgi:hypothetical protein